MSGMPWQLSYAASADLDNSELQTDVMRFMAILAFCLVAIFAIVQTMPLGSQSKEPAQPVAGLVANSRMVPIVERVSAPDQLAAEKKHATRDEPIRVSRPTEKRPVPAFASVAAKPEPRPAPRAVSIVAPIATKPVQQPAAEPDPVAVTVPIPPKSLVPSSTRTAPETAPVTNPAPVEKGLSLSFESDLVLRNLVERRLVGLYAIAGSDFYQMRVSGQAVQFGPATAPAQYHEMVYETVPRDVAQIFETQHHGVSDGVIWGVTLPVGTTQQLLRFVQTRYAGELIITADAQLTLGGSY